MAFEWTPDLVNRVRNYRRTQRKQTMGKVLGALAEEPQDLSGTYMSGDQKNQARMAIFDKMEKQNQFYHKQAQEALIERQKNIRQGYEALLRSETAKMQEAGASARAAAKLQTAALDKDFATLENRLQDMRTPDPMVAAETKATATNIGLTVDREALREAVELREALSTYEGRSEFRRKLMDNGMSYRDAETQVQRQTDLLSSSNGLEQVAAERKQEMIETGNLPSEVADTLKVAVESALSDNTPPAQSLHMLNMLGSAVGQPGRRIAQLLGREEDVIQRERETTQEHADLLEALSQASADRVQASRRAFGSSGNMQQAQQALASVVQSAGTFNDLNLEQRDDVETGERDVAPGVSDRAGTPMARASGAAGGGAGGGPPGTTPEVGEASTSGGGTPTTPGDAPDPDGTEAEAPYAQRLRALSGGGRAGEQRLMEALQFIEDYPDAPPAQYMRQQLMESPSFKEYQKVRGYEGFDSKKVFREFKREAAEQARKQDQKFRKVRDMNRRLNASRTADKAARTGDSLVHGGTSPTQAQEAPGGGRQQ